VLRLRHLRGGQHDAIGEGDAQRGEDEHGVDGPSFLRSVYRQPQLPDCWSLASPQHADLAEGSQQVVFSSAEQQEERDGRAPFGGICDLGLVVCVVVSIFILLVSRSSVS